MVLAYIARVLVDVLNVFKMINVLPNYALLTMFVKVVHLILNVQQIIVPLIMELVVHAILMINAIHYIVNQAHVQHAQRIVNAIQTIVLMEYVSPALQILSVLVLQTIAHQEYALLVKALANAQQTCALLVEYANNAY